ncbi:MAG: hypothetical protein ACT4QB_02500 [Gammaproteobacteria bacterium]
MAVEALVPVAGHLGLEPGHAVLDLVVLGDAANGDSTWRVMVAPKPVLARSQDRLVWIHSAS